MGSPPWTNLWDETKPADSDLANTLGSQGRQLKLDVRQRADWQHVWGHSGADDGGHRYIAITSAYHPAEQETLIARGFSISSSNANSMVDLAGTWNTSGKPSAIKLNVTDSASDAASLLLDLQVGGSSKFSVSKAGVATAGGIVLGTGIYTVGLGNPASQSISGGTSASATAATDGFITAFASCATGADQYILRGQVGATTLQQSTASSPSTGVNHSICFPVKKGGVWSVSLTIVTGSPAIGAVYFTPLS